MNRRSFLAWLGFAPVAIPAVAPAGSGGGDTVVNIIGQRGSGQIEQRESTGANGQKQIDIMILDSVNRLAGRKK